MFQTTTTPLKHFAGKVIRRGVIFDAERFLGKVLKRREKESPFWTTLVRFRGPVHLRQYSYPKTHSSILSPKQRTPLSFIESRWNFRGNSDQNSELISATEVRRSFDFLTRAGAPVVNSLSLFFTQWNHRVAPYKNVYSTFQTVILERWNEDIL